MLFCKSPQKPNSRETQANASVLSSWTRLPMKSSLLEAIQFILLDLALCLHSLIYRRVFDGLTFPGLINNSQSWKRSTFPVALCHNYIIAAGRRKENICRSDDGIVIAVVRVGRHKSEVGGRGRMAGGGGQSGVFTMRYNWCNGRRSGILDVLAA